MTATRIDNRFLASYFDGVNAQMHVVHLEPGPDAIVMVRSDGPSIPLLRADLAWIGPPDARRPMLRIATGGELVLHGPDAARDLRIPAVAMSFVERAQRSNVLATGAVIALAVIVVLALAWVIPRTSEFAADYVPWRTELQLGTEALRVVDRAILAPSDLSTADQARLQARFAHLAKAGNLDGTRLEIRNGMRIGPNAAALPGRIVIVTDQIVRLMGDSASLDAVIAHELGHVQHRHGTRALMRQAGVAVVVGTALHDPSLLRSVAGMAPQTLLQAAHSREAEREADAFALDLLNKVGTSPAALADAMRQLQAEAMRRGAIEASNYVSSHPPTQERIDAALEVARRKADATAPTTRSP